MLRQRRKLVVLQASVVIAVLAAITAGSSSANPRIPRLASQGASSPPLIGSLYARWGLIGCETEHSSIVSTYADPGVRERVRLQLAAMHAAGLSTLRLGLWNADDPSLGAALIPTRSGGLVEPYRTNLRRFVTDVRSAGFTSLTVSFSPYATNDPIGSPVNTYDPRLFEQNWSFMRDVRPIVKEYGPATTRFDLLMEGPPPSYLDTYAQLMTYMTEIYRRYADAFGTSDAEISTIAPPEPGANIDTQPEFGHRIQNLIDALRASGRPLPQVFPIHIATWWEPSEKHALYALREVDNALTANGLPQPLIVGETVYEDSGYARAIQTFRERSSRPILEVQEWPLERVSACTGFSVAPPYTADAYIEALTGTPRATRITARLSTSGHAALVAPYGMPATALVEGAYTLTVTDQSRMLRFGFVGPGINLRTVSTYTGRKTWSIRLRKGTYSYGALSKSRYRLVVL
jgi:hypothetical protein